MADDYSDPADSSGIDFNSLLTTAVNAAPGVVKALTGTPTSATGAVAGTPATAAQAQSASSLTKFLPWGIGAIVLLIGAMFLFGRKRG
jgi:hypothetical protein